LDRGERFGRECFVAGADRAAQHQLGTLGKSVGEKLQMLLGLAVFVACFGRL